MGKGGSSLCQRKREVADHTVFAVGTWSEMILCVWLAGFPLFIQPESLVRGTVPPTFRVRQTLGDSKCSVMLSREMSCHSLQRSRQWCLSAQGVWDLDPALESSGP